MCIEIPKVAIFYMIEALSQLSRVDYQPGGYHVFYNTVNSC